MRVCNTEQFIKKASDIHKNKYDYSKSVYINKFTKLIIICPFHGEFSQRPPFHLQGRGCYICGRVLWKKLVTHDNEKFILNAKIIHNSFYDYSEVNYINNFTKVKIICPQHGVFLQEPSNHLSGQGCIKCRNKKFSRENTLTLTEFIIAATNIHKNRYDYSNVNYIHGKLPISIICHRHGIFNQTPSVHLAGHGCPKCNLSVGELKIMEFLNVNNIEYEYQKTFDDCRNPKTKWMLKFDFYVSSHNLLIEYDGKQHYESGGFCNKHKFTAEELDAIKYKDTIKTYYAMSNGICLIRIKYTELSEIEEKLKSVLNLL